MLTTAFDTYAAAKRLRDAGFDERQAEAAVSMVRDAAGADLANLATKADIDALRTATKADITALKGDIAGIDSRIDSLRAELGTVRWPVGLTAAFLFVIGLRVFGLI